MHDDHRTQRMERLLGRAQDLLTAGDAARLLDVALQCLIAFTGAERGLLLLREPTGRPRVGAAHDIDRAEVRGEAFRRVRHLADSVLAEGTPFHSADLSRDPRLVDAEGAAAAPRSVVLVPMRSRGRTTGALFLDRASGAGALDPRDLPALQGFLDVTGLALEQRQRLRRLELSGEELRVANSSLEQAMSSLQDDVAAKSVELAQVERDLHSSKRALGERFGFKNIIGRSPNMRRVFEMVHQVMDYPVPVLVSGESGTGKELIARALHYAGPRHQQPFMAINCAAIPDNLLESELFGYKRGAFTGAYAAKEGLFRAARAGVVFLDEIREMPLPLQAKLLRVLQEKEVRPIGGRDAEPVEARIIAATNRELRDEVAAGRFREDLFYRLAVVEIRVPPLRDRIEDLPALAEHFLAKLSEDVGLPHKRLSRRALQRLMQAPWPGNVRQLENAIKSSAILSRSEVISADELRLQDLEPGGPGGSSSVERVAGELPAPGPSAWDPPSGAADQAHRTSGEGPIRNRADWEAREHTRILEALVECGWNKTRAALRLGISRRNLYRKLARYGIEGAED